MTTDQAPVITALYEAQTAGEPVVLATVISTHGSIPRHAGSKMLIHQDSRTVGTVGGGAMEALVIQAALAALQDGQSRLERYTLNNLEDGDPGICGGTAQIFIEPIGLVPTLLVIGGGHCGYELAGLGKWLGYRVLLSDDRAAFCNPNYLPGLDGYIVCKPGEITQRVAITHQTYVAAVTRGLPIDLELLPALLHTNAAYIGLIGSRRRWSLTVETLKTHHGLTEGQLARIHAPIGLDIEAETPKEIAVSIMAEIILKQRGGTGLPMKKLGEMSKNEVE